MKLEKGTKLVMIGDSITDCERRRPYGEGIFEGVGRGYVALVDAHLQTTYPELDVRIINMGISGNTVRDLKERWQSDVMDLKPDWLSIMIGINDVWRHFDEPKIKENHISIEEYEHTLKELIEQVRPSLKGLILMTPYLIEKHDQDEMKQQMIKYGTRVKHLAEKYDALFIDVQKEFDDLLQYFYSSTIASDRVHPSMIGHMVIARAFLNAIGYDWQKNIK